MSALRTGATGGRVLLVVGGGIAAYKAPELVRELVRRGLEVQVVTTAAASAFVTELSLAVVSKRPVRSTLLDPSHEVAAGQTGPAGPTGQVGHIELADWADVVLVAPATANLLSRAAHGLADDLATTVLLATTAPVLWAPAMNVNMWRHPATRRSLALLAQDGASFIGPDSGDLACGWVGEGRMIDPPIIADGVVRRIVAGGPATSRGASTTHGPAPAASRGRWHGRRVLVSAGPTRAYLDPVRFVSNASTGAMGFALASAAADAGAEVVLVSGPVALATPQGVRRIDVETASELHGAMERELGAAPFDLVAMAAAVSDLSPAPSAAKLDKDALVEHVRTMTWTKEVDVLATLAERHGATSRFMGFAAQTIDDGDPATMARQLVALATEKLRRKRVPCVFVNRVGVPESGFSTPTNAGWLVVARGDAVQAFASGPPRPKAEVATWLLDIFAREVLGVALSPGSTSDGGEAEDLSGDP